MGEFHESPDPKIPPNKNKYLKNQKQNKKTRKFIISFACPYHSRTENCKKYFPHILYLTILWDLKFYLYLWLLSIFNTSLKTVKIYVNKNQRLENVHELSLSSCGPQTACRPAKPARHTFCAKQSHNTNELNSLDKLETNTDRSAAVKVSCYTTEETTEGGL